MRENEPGKAIFITNLKRLLEENNVKQYELAKAIGVTSGVVSFWLKGTNYPRIATMQKIADYFRVPIESLTTPQPTTDEDAKRKEFESLLAQMTDEEKKLVRGVIIGILNNR